MATASPQDSDLCSNGGGMLAPPTIMLPEASAEDEVDYEGAEHMDMEDPDLPDRFKHFTLRKQTSYR